MRRLAAVELPRWGRFGTAVVVLALGCLVGSVSTTLLSTSPQQAAAQRAVPTLAAPSVQVTSMVMKDLVEGQCQPTSGLVGVPAPAVDAGEIAVVTSVPVTAGASVHTGSLLAVVSASIHRVVTAQRSDLG